MKLEMASFPIKDIRFGKHTRYEDGVLEIDKGELIDLVLEDKRVASADLDIALPGEQTRIVGIRDAVAPIVKVSGPGGAFPGIVGPVETVGQGRTNTLPNVVVMHACDYQATVTSGTGAGTKSVVDMWEPGASMTPLGSTMNVVLMTKLIDGVTEWEAHSAIVLAECKVAQRLAETTRDSNPESVEVFELADVDPSLPRFIYMLGSMTEWHTPHSSIAYYGLPVKESLPTFMHPNEILDGALTTDARRGHSRWPTTWRLMRQPVVLALMKEHGKRLNFVGVILQRTRFESEFGKQVGAMCTAQMAKLLKADNAIITRTSPSGNNLMDAMFTVQACESKGINALLLTPEAGGSDGTGPALYFYAPEAKAMVSTGNLNREPDLPVPAKVIGCEKDQPFVLRPGSAPIYPWGKLKFDTLTDIADGVDWYGGSNYTCRLY